MDGEYYYFDDDDDNNANYNDVGDEQGGVAGDGVAGASATTATVPGVAAVATTTTAAAPDAALESAYVNGKRLMYRQTAECIQSMQGVMRDAATAAGAPGGGGSSIGARWTFKALRVLVRATCVARQYDDMVTYYTQLAATRTCTDVTDAQLQRALTKALTESHTAPAAHVEQLVRVTLAAVAARDRATFARLWLQALTLHVEHLLSRAQYAEADTQLRAAVRWCHAQQQHRATAAAAAADGGGGGVSMAVLGSSSSSSSHHADLFGLYAMQMRVYAATGQHARLRLTYHAALRVTDALLPSQMVAQVLACAGQMYMRDGDWHAARSAFDAAARHYAERDSDVLGAVCDKCATVATMLCGAPLRVTATTTAATHAVIHAAANSARDDDDDDDDRAASRCAAVQRLAEAWVADDVSRFYALATHDNSNNNNNSNSNRDDDAAAAAELARDADVAPYLPRLLFCMRLRVLVEYASAFTSVALTRLAARVAADMQTTRQLCNYALLHGMLAGYLDRTHDMLYLRTSDNDNNNNEDDGGGGSAQRGYAALRAWSRSMTPA